MKLEPSSEACLEGEGGLLIELQPIDTSVREVLDESLGRMKPSLRRDRLKGVVVDVVLAEQQYLLAARRGQHRDLMPPTEDSTLKKDMAWIYSEKFVDRDDDSTYTAILGTTDRGLCPYCSCSRASTLDHNLPKSRFPLLAVTPANLVPACKDCNMDKRAAVGPGNLSPYWDSWAASQAWLSARVVDSAHPEDLDFFVTVPEPMTAGQVLALTNYFAQSGVGPRFSTLAADEWLTFREVFATERAVGVEALEVELERRLRSCQARNLNGWRTAAYAAWLDRAADILAGT